MAEQPEVVCLGEAMVEFNQRQDGLFVQGFGGDTSNCAISAARQNASVGYLTSIGNDQFGAALRSLWQTENVDISQVLVNPNAPTGIYFVRHDSDGHHYTYYRKHSAASLMRPEDLPAAYIAGARILHVSAISQAISESAAATVNAAIQIANENNTLVAYDTNLRLNLWGEQQARSVIHEAMANCQIALPSYDDATTLCGKARPDDIIDFYLSLGAEVVVLKLGAEGSIVATSNTRDSIRGRRVDSIDTNGAGDTFAGAFLAEVAAGRDYVSAAKYANVAASLSTCRSGAVTAIHRREEVEAVIQG